MYHVKYCLTACELSNCGTASSLWVIDWCHSRGLRECKKSVIVTEHSLRIFLKMGQITRPFSFVFFLFLSKRSFSIWKLMLQFNFVIIFYNSKLLPAILFWLLECNYVKLYSRLITNFDSGMTNSEDKKNIPEKV